MLNKEQKVPRYAIAIGMLYFLSSKDVEHKSATQRKNHNSNEVWLIKNIAHSYTV